MFSIRLLSSKDNRDDFDCGEDALNIYIRQRAQQDVRRNLAVCYVLIDDDRPDAVAGFYTLSATGIGLADMPESAQRKIRYRNIPAALLGRLAVDAGYQGRGLGRAMLADAIDKVASSGIGCYAIVVDAKDETACRFYQSLGFTPFEEGGLRLYYIL